MMVIPQGLLISYVFPHLSLDALLRLGCTNSIMRQITLKQIEKIVSDDQNLGKLATHFCCNVLLRTSLNVSWTLAIDPAYKSARLRYRRAFHGGFSGYLNCGRDITMPHFNPLYKFCEITVWGGAIICEGGLAFQFSGREGPVLVRLECRYTSPTPLLPQPL